MEGQREGSDRHGGCEKVIRREVCERKRVMMILSNGMREGR